MRRMMTALVFLAMLPSLAYARTQESFEWFPGGTYDSRIPTPQSFLGYEIGDQFTFHSRMKGYLEAVAAASDRVTIRSYGSSYQGRDLLLLTISSPQNLGRLEQIRSNMARLVDPRGASRAELDRVIASSPAVAWMSYNVHGSESSGTEAAMQVVYQLAAGTDPVTLRILDELVVILDPLLNPDGRDRYVHSIRTRLGAQPNAHRDAWEHGESWPGSRSNHFFFDLNRDWAWQTQRETRLRIEEYLKWNPVVHVDAHEMGSASSYFFFPADVPVHASFPDEVMRWQEIYGRANAAAFDAFGWPYYTRQTFDLYYPAYGDSWPTMMGAIGMTYEQGGGSGAGLALERADGFVLTLRHRAHGHFTTSMATLHITAERRQDRLHDFAAFFQTAIGRGDGPVKAYALVPDRDGYNADQLVGLLRRQGIEVTRAAEGFRARIAGGYGPGPFPDRKEFPAGTWLVASGQPRGIAVEVLLEPQPVLEDTSFYDLSAWSLPLAYNVEAWTLSESPSVRMLPAEPIRPPAGGLSAASAPYAWVIPYEGMRSLLAAVDLLNDGVRVLSANESFTSAGREYPPGSFVLPLWRNPDNLTQLLDRAVRHRGVTAYPLATGLVEQGQDLGTGGYRELRAPRIAIAAGPSAGGFGEVWHFFEERFPFFDYTNIDADRLSGVDLSRYDVLFLPGGGNYSRVFGEAGTTRLREWIQQGGVVIGFEGGAQFLTQEGSRITGVSTREEQEGDRDRTPPAELAVERRRTVEQRRQESQRGRTPGGLYEVVLDPGHWMAYGMSERVPVLVRRPGGFTVTDRGVNVAVFSPTPLLSGYAPQEVPARLARRSWLIVENVGRGKAVLFADNPLFRMFVEGQFQLVLNAVVLGPGW
jgi:hypothetical protein